MAGWSEVLFAHRDDGIVFHSVFEAMNAFEEEHFGFL